MPAVKIVLSLFCQIAESGQRCQVNLRRSVYEVDSDIEEIKLPLQAIVKLKRVQPVTQSLSASILPLPQHAQISLPVISNIATSAEDSVIPAQVQGKRKTNVVEEKGRSDRLSRRRSSSAGQQKSNTISADRLEAEDLKEIKTMLFEMKEKLNTLDKAATFDAAETEEPMVSMGLEKTGRASSVVRRTHTEQAEQGADAMLRASEATNCPFVQYIFKRHDDLEGSIDMTTPISAIVGPNYSLFYKQDSRRSSIVEPEAAGGAVSAESSKPGALESDRSIRSDRDTSNVSGSLESKQMSETGQQPMHLEKCSLLSQGRADLSNLTCNCQEICDCSSVNRSYDSTQSNE